MTILLKERWSQQVCLFMFVKGLSQLDATTPVRSKTDTQSFLAMDSSSDSTPSNNNTQ